MREPKKVPITRHLWAVLLRTCVHLVAVLGALIILSLNLSRLWIGKELQGSISEDGQKLFALQLTAKVHELFMAASLSHVVSSTFLKRLAAGVALPLAVLGAGMQSQDGSYLFTRDFLAFCTAEFRGKIFLVVLVFLSMVLALTVGPSSATAMTPLLDEWPAGDTTFALNATHGQLWPTRITGASPPTNNDAAWSSIEQNLLSYWGHETVGGWQCGPEIVAVPSLSSVRTMDVRFRGPFSLYQPLYTAVTIQMAVVADAVNSMRVAWGAENANCAWARSRIKGGFCTYKDIQWKVHALQPVVYTRCLLQESVNDSLTFPTLTRGDLEPTEASVSVKFSSQKRGSDTVFQGVSLVGEDFAGTSVGILVRTKAFVEAGDPQLYVCAVDAQWAYADAKTSFLGTSYAVSGSPTDFVGPNATASTYQGWRVTIDPAWVPQINPSLRTNSANVTAFDRLIAAGAAVNSDRKVEAVLAVLLAKAMASLGSDAVIQTDTLDSESVLGSIESTAERLRRTPGYDSLTFRASVTGYAYGISSASGVSISSLLSVIILSCYVLTATTFLVSEALSKYHVNSWKGFTDMLALALHSFPSPELKNTSCGVASLDTLRTPVTFAVRNGTVEMVIGQRRSIAKVGYHSLEPYRAYS